MKLSLSNPSFLLIKYSMIGGLFLGSLSNFSSTFAATQTVAPAQEILDHPPLSPQKDVTVIYRFHVGQTEIAADKMKQVQVAFAAAGNRLRIDQIGGPGVTVLDRPTQTVTLVNKQTKSYVQFRPQHGIHNPFMLDISMKYRAGSMENIAGYPCRQWFIETGSGKAESCVTADGVILSEKGVDADGVSGVLEAVSVSYGEIAVNQFEPPADFQKIMPHMVSLMPNPEQQQNNQQERNEPPPANDSVTDGTIQHADQPSSANQ